MFNTQHAKNKDGSVHVILTGALDAAAAERFETELETLLAEGVLFLVIDMENLHYLASAGLRVLLSGAKKGKKQGMEIVLCSLQPLVFSVFDSAGFTRIFPVFKSREEAHKSRHKGLPA